MIKPQWEIDEDGWGFSSPDGVHYTHDGHYGKTQKHLKAEVVFIVNRCNREEQ